MCTRDEYTRHRNNTYPGIGRGRARDVSVSGWSVGTALVASIAKVESGILLWLGALAALRASIGKAHGEGQGEEHHSTVTRLIIIMHVGRRRGG